MSTAFSLDLDIKAFKGKGAFRALVARQRAIVEAVHAEMQQMELDVAALDLPMLLVTLRDRKVAPYVKRMRLRWRVRGRSSPEST